MKVRRVVTGHNREGKATVASDVLVDGLTIALAPGTEFHRMWGADEPPAFPDDGSPRPAPSYFPPVGGFRFILFTIPPENGPQPEVLDVQEGLKEIEAKLPGLAAAMEPGHPGMHTTDTIDFEYVVSGETSLELDDGVEVHLAAGDTVVQNGTRHAWRNRGSVPCRMVVCQIGAYRR